MRKATGSPNLLDDLSNLATAQAYQELISSIFVAESSPTSRIEAWPNPQARSVAATQQGQLDTRDGGREEIIASRTLTKGTLSASQSLGANRLEVKTSTITDVEGLEPYTNCSEGVHAFFIRKRNSYSALSVSRSLFEGLCEGLDIPSRFRDYLVYFGKKDHEIEIAPPPLIIIRDTDLTLNYRPEWQIMGIVRFMETNWRSDVSEPSLKWSIRQTAVFCRFSNDQAQVLWLFVSISAAVEEMLKSVWSAQSQAGGSPFRSVYALYHFAVCNWRPYVVALVQETEKHEMEQLGSNPEDTGPVPLAGSEERQALLILEKKVLTAKLAIQSTKADLQFFRDEAQQWSSDRGGRDENDRDLSRRLAESMRDLDVTLMRIEQLHARLQGITNLVSSFLDLSSGHALQVLTQESKMESQNMRILNEEMARLAERNNEEAATVSVLAVLTLIYLPLTVVSNFFSTSFVGTGPSSNRIYVTGDWWILFVVAVPLTVLTIYVWRVWAEIKARYHYPFWWSLLGLKKRKKPGSPERHWGYDYELPPGPQVSRSF